MNTVFQLPDPISLILWAIVIIGVVCGMLAMAAPHMVGTLKDMLLQEEPLYSFDDWRDLTDDQVIRIRTVKQLLDEMGTAWTSFKNGAIYVSAAGDLFFYPDGNTKHKLVPYKLSDIKLDDIVEYLVFEVENGVVLLPDWMD